MQSSVFYQQFFRITVLVLLLSCNSSIFALDNLPITGVEAIQKTYFAQSEYSCSGKYSFKTENLFIDDTVLNLDFAEKPASDVFHLFSHGKPGELLIEGEWKTAPQIAQWLKNRIFFSPSQTFKPPISHLNLYGCHFAKGEKGRIAVKYLEAALHISVAASDDITGKDGDWELEVGKAKDIPIINHYQYNLQACTGTVVSVVSHTGVVDSSEVIGSADGQDGNQFNQALLWDQNDQITMELAETLPAGYDYTIHWRKQSGSVALTVTVEESVNGIAFTAASGSPFTVAGASSSSGILQEVITTSGSTRYIRVTKTSQFANLNLDAVTYEPNSPSNTSLPFLPGMAVISCFSTGEGAGSIGSDPNGYVLGVLDLRCPEDNCAGFEFAWDEPATRAYHGPLGTEWTAGLLGEVGGLTIRESTPTIFTTSFGVTGNVYTDLESPSLAGGNGGGHVFALDGTTGAASLLASLPNTEYVLAGTPDNFENYAGLGQITYNVEHDLLYVSNLDDGKIYTINATSGMVNSSTYDHGVLEGVGADDTDQIYTQMHRMAFGVGYNALFGRLFYAVPKPTSKFSPLDLATIINEVWSVAVDNTTGLPIAGTRKKEFEINFEEDGVTAGTGSTFALISDIAFSDDNLTMLIGEGSFERTTIGNADVISANGVEGNPTADATVNQIIPYKRAHVGNAYRYSSNLTGNWMNDNISYYVGYVASHDGSNISGGLDFGYNNYGDCSSESVNCEDAFLAVADQISSNGTDLVYGVVIGNTDGIVDYATIPSDAYFVDVDGLYNGTNNKFSYFDIESMGSLTCPCDKPNVTAFAIQSSCTDGVPNSDGNLQISQITDGDRFNWSTGSTYSGDTDYSNATDTLGLTFPITVASNLANPSGEQYYTIRVFNGADDCFTDVVVTMKQQDCTVGCNCEEYIYLNDVSIDAVHKFRVASDGVLTEIGSPWIPNGTINNPHGLAVDLNGNLFIGQADNFNNNVPNGPVFKLDCDGNILASDILNPVVEYGYNFFSKDGILYTFDNNSNEVKAYDLCDGGYLGAMNFVPSAPFGVNWGMYIDDTHWYLADYGNDRVMTGALDITLFSDPATNSGSVLFSLDAANNRPLGITRDVNGNFFIVDGNPGNPQEISIYKYTATGALITSITDNVYNAPPNTTDGVDGFYGGRGIAYSPTANLLYFGSFENCIAVFDTNLVQQTALNIGNPIPTAPKGIAIARECCPTNNNLTVDTTICAGTQNAPIFLQELINCDGSICEGLWQEGLSNSGLTYNSCNNSVTIDSSNACGTFTLESDGTGNNPQCGAFKITVNINVVSLAIAATQTNCTDNGDGTFTADYEVIVDWSNATCSYDETITVTHNDSNIGTIDATTDTSPDTFNISIPANGEGTQSFKAAFTEESGCSADSISFKTPIPCPLDVSTCVLTSGCLGGNAFEDFNCNGTDDASELGVQGVQVVIYDCDNNPVDTTWTDSEGDWQVCSLTDGAIYRVEFILPESIACWAQPTHAGSDNGTDIQFLTVPACAKFGLSSSSDYCQEDPELITTCYTNGDYSNGSAAFDPGFYKTIVRFPYSSTGQATAPVGLADGVETGNVYGLAWNREAQELYSSSFVKRHSGLPTPTEMGRIYVTDTPFGSPTTSTFIDLIALGEDVGQGLMPANRVLGRFTGNPSQDSLVFHLIGKVGLGDLEISDDNTKLYVMNLFQKEVIEMDILTQSITTKYPVPDMDCINGETRPFALKFRKGTLYMGAVCSAENGGASANLSAAVFELAGTKFNQVTEIALDYNRSYINGTLIAANWQPWTNSWQSLSPGSNIILPQPILSDIEIDVDGSLILGFMDRIGHQTGVNNWNLEGTGNFSGVIGGDLIRICKINGNYVLEGNGGCSYNVTPLQNGSAGGEYYHGENYNTHHETANGGLLLLPGKGEIATTGYDPFEFNSGGIFWLDNTMGGDNRRYEVFGSGDPGNFGKAAGLGDLEALCNPAPIEIGNYVWCDSIENGIQDACERGINDMIVQLYDRNGNLVGQDTTVNGNYYFNQNNVDTTGITIDGSGNATPNDTWSGMSYSTQYFIVFGNGQYIGEEFTVGSETYPDITSMANAGSNDNIDSDVDGNSLTVGSLGARPDGLPFIDLTTSPTGCGDHKYDMGITCSTCPEIDSLITDREICSGNLVDSLVVTTTFNHPDSIAFVYFNDAQTDSMDIYTMGIGIDTIQIANDNDTVGIYNIGNFTNLGITADTFYVYAIAHPTPSDNTCRPYEEILIIVQPTPTANTTSIELCGDGDAMADFDLTTVENTITGGATGVTITWYNDMGLSNSIGSPATYSSNTAIVYAEVTNTTTNCTANIPVNLVVKTVEIGNYVWCDSTLNGIQDPLEPGVDSLLVQLYTAGNVLIGQDTTDATGAYLFNQSNVDTFGITVDGNGVATPNTVWSGLAYNTDYQIVFGAGQYQGGDGSFQVGADTYGGFTLPNQGGGDGLDSDVEGATFFTFAGSKPRFYPEINITTPANGCEDTSFDLGLLCGDLLYSLGNQVFFDVDNSGDLNGAEAGIDGVQLRLLNSDDSVYDSDTSTTGIQPLIVTTASGGYYRFDSLPAGNYQVEVMAVNFQLNEVLENYLSSTGANEEIAPNTSGDSNDNGIDEVSGAILSRIVTLGALEPLGEMEPVTYGVGSTTGMAATDGLSNLTVDFGFYLSCLTIDNPISQRIICQGEAIDTLAITTTFINPDSIAFVYFTTPQLDSSIIYAGGIGMDTIQIDSGNDTVRLVNVDVPSFTLMGLMPDTFYVYAIAHPAPVDNTCRPFAEIQVRVNACDWGDLPDVANGTTGINDYETYDSTGGPSHQIITGLFLGDTVDAEIDGFPDSLAVGDDNDGVDDEDGISIFSSLDIRLGGIIRLPLSVTNTTTDTAYLEAWIDWNGDGAFDGVNEMVVDLKDNEDGVFPAYLEINIPTDAVSGSLLGFRIRLSNTDNMTPYGRVNSGEVEDYLIGIDCPQMNCLPVETTKIRK